MSQKFHINEKGEPGVCRAEVKCPLGGVEEHYETKVDAQKAYEAKMTAEIVPEGVSKQNLNATALNRLAKISSDPELLTEAAERGSERVLKNLVKNGNVPADALVVAAGRTNDQELKDQFYVHPNFPADKLSPKSLVDACTKQNAVFSTFKKDGINDDHVAALLDHYETTKERGGLRGNYRTAFNNAIISNPNNQVSQETVESLAATDSSSLLVAVDAGRYRPEKIADLKPNHIDWVLLQRTKDPEVIDKLVDWQKANEAELTANGNSYTYERGFHDLARNPNTSAGSLQKIAETGFAQDTVYEHANVSPETKAYLAETNPRVRKIARLEKLTEKHGDLAKHLVTDASTSSPYGRNKGYNVYTRKLDTAKVKELGLDSEEIGLIMRSGQFNAGANYNPETGVFTGSVDSGD